MRNSLRIAALGAAVAVASLATSAQAASSASASATATILSALNVTNTAPLAFDTIAVNGAGTVVVAPNGNISCTAGALVCPGFNSSAAAFKVTGDTGTNVAVTLPTTASILTLSPWTGTGAAPTMTVDGFNTGFPSGSTIAATGTTFNVGGVLHVAAAQAAGAYSGTFSVSVNYQ